VTVIWSGHGGGQAPTLDDEEAGEEQNSLSGRNPALASAPRIGRYAILRTIGSGGMGVVQAAYDEALDRKVAIKFIHEERSRQPKARQRMLREAQVMARLSHPNVVHVYEVAEHRRRLYIAMEYVDGVNLQQWLAQRPRRWDETMAVFLEAGAGLAAAHRAGIIHRDFKPENVLIDSEGRAKVADFGVAGVDWELTETGGSAVGETTSLTAAGALLGTPAYMAPEQYQGERSDALSDQFSFCVALYESLYGEHPFLGDAVMELTRSISDGHRRPRPREQEVPRWVYAALQRGLRHDPLRRYPSMEALLAVLRRRSYRRAPIWIAAGSALIGSAAAVVVIPGDLHENPCSDVPTADEIWNADRRRDVEASLFATNYAATGAIWQRAEPKLRRFTEQWSDLSAKTCETRSKWEDEPELLVQREQCLERARFAFETRVDALQRANAATVERAVALVDGLPDLDGCLDPDELSLSEQLAPPANLVPIVASFDRRVVEAQALMDAGEHEEALSRTQTLLPEVEKTGYTRLISRVRALQARSLEQLGRFEAAQEAAHTAYIEALQAGDDDLAVDSLRRSATQLARRLQRPDEALSQLRVAEALLRRAGLENTPVRAMLWLETGWAQMVLDRYDEAISSMTRGLVLLERLEGPGSQASHAFHFGLGSLYMQLGQYTQAQFHFGQWVEVMRIAYGDEHSATARAESSLGEAELALGHVDEAARLFEHAATVLRASRLDRESPMLARTLNYLAMTEQARHRFDRAIELHEQAIAINEAIYGREGTWTAAHEVNLGIALHRAGRLPEALEHLRHALQVLTQSFGPDSPRIAGAHLALGEALTAAGEIDPALAELRRALELNEATFGPDYPPNADILLALGEALQRHDEDGAAAEVLDRARELAPPSTPVAPRTGVETPAEVSPRRP
jgi:serine/threonine protein kinase/tetratricopeptide (TPR) repeat protein